MHCGMVQVDDPDQMDVASCFLQWENDTLDNLGFSDALWGFMIQAHDKLVNHRTEVINDPVIERLLEMGIYDWREMDMRSDKESNSMRLAACLGM